MPNRKKTLTLMVHLPAGVKDKLEAIRKKLKLKLLSDVIIMAVEQYKEPNDETM